MRSARVPVIAVALILLLAACNAPSGSDGGGGNDATESSSATVDEASNPTATEDTPDTGGGAGGGGDLGALADELAPPNGNEQARFNADGGVIVNWLSSDDVESVKSYYDGQLSSMGLNVLQTTSIQGTYGWVFGNEDGSGTSGALTIGPDSGSGGTSVSLTLGSS
jgi:hypothetical protein